jgi:hypothetical protein
VHALSGLELLEHTQGNPRYIGEFTLPGPVSKFRATRTLIRRAADAGVDLSEIDRHFHIKPPKYPLVLKAAKVGSARKIAGVRRTSPGIPRPSGWKAG